MTRKDSHGNRQRSVPLTFGACLIVCHYTDGTRRYFRASARGLRVTEWTRAEAAQYSRRFVEVSK